jgi:hypothetical protein
VPASTLPISSGTTFGHHRKKNRRVLCHEIQIADEPCTLRLNLISAVTDADDAPCAPGSQHPDNSGRDCRKKWLEENVGALSGQKWGDFGVCLLGLSEERRCLSEKCWCLRRCLSEKCWCLRRTSGFCGKNVRRRTEHVGDRRERFNMGQIPR